MCTGIRLKARNGSIVYGRTMEFGLDIDSKMLFTPRNYEFQGTTEQGSNGLKWKSKYATVGPNASGVINFVDGINEVGLAGGLFYFPEYAKYQEIEDSQLSNSIAPWELLTWVLTNFNDIHQVKKELPKIKVGNVIFKAWGIVPPVHAIIYDSLGNSLVVEYINGNLIMSDNAIGVFTNSPSFDWHLTNLRNYVNLSSVNVQKIELSNIIFNSLGQGSGMLGLPGDFTSPSRFIRAVAFSQSVVNINDESDALKNLFHILNLFDIPYGSIRQFEKNGNSDFEYTQWTSGIDLKDQRYYFHTYDNRNIRYIDLKELNLKSSNYQLFDMNQKEIRIDITK